MNEERPLFDDLELLGALLELDGVERAERQVLPRTEDASPKLSRAQRRIWFLHQMAPDSPVYNITSAVRLSGWLDVEALRHSVSEIVRRHESLRTCFPAAEGRPEILISRDATMDIPIEDLTGIEQSLRQELVTRECEAEAQRSFDLASGPLLRLRLLCLGKREHVALLSLHHIVADGWSMGVLFSELIELYASYTAGRLPRITEPSIQYRDFAAWQEQWLEQNAGREQLRWWTERLAGITSLQLPTDRPRPARPTYRGAAYTFSLPNQVAAAIQEIGRRESATLFMTLLAAFAVLLHRYTGQQDIVVGSPVANRNRRETEPLIGLFVNTLVMRCDLSGRPGFVDLVRRVRDFAAEALARQDLPFDELVKILAPDRDLSSNPLFQVMFSVDSAPGESVGLPGLKLTPIEVPTRVAKFDLQFNVTRDGEGRLMGAFEYATDLFDTATIGRMAGHFTTLIAAIANDPNVSVDVLPLLTAVEKTQFEEWNETAIAYPRDSGLASLFERQVERRPDDIAVKFGTEQLTYGQLNARANRLARRLRECGVGIETPVAIHALRSVAMIVGLVAIVKSGGTYVPLDPTYPTQRLAFMLGNCQAAVLLTGEGLANEFSRDTTIIIRINEALDPARYDDANPDWSTASGANLAYISYTSGSTGRPKGVSVPHRAVARLVLGTNYVALQSDDVIAQASNASFDAATFEIWGSLLNGARLTGVNQDVVLSPPLLATFLREHQVTTLFLTTALFNQVARDQPSAFESLRHLLFGGEQVNPHRVRAVLQHGPPQRLLHVYGPTENTTFSTWKLVADVRPDATTVPIGKALANTQLYVLDSQSQPVPVGILGELYLGGDGLARGYYGDPVTTRECFIANPIGSGLTTLYRTGDIVRRLPDGDIEFVGRRDNQIKIRGYRIELGEIEAALLRQPVVEQAAVLARQERPGQITLAAYVAGAQHELLNAAVVRQRLAEYLPSYMVPAMIVVLPSLPLTENGKVDRHALPVLPAVTDRVMTMRPPRDQREACLADAWRDVLGRTELGIDDNYFEAGGDSITAIQIVSRLRRSGWQIRVADLFRHPTIADLAPQLRQDDASLCGAETHELDEATELPLTVIQRWFLDRTDGNIDHFNQAVLLRASEVLEEAAVRSALGALLARHDALRLRVVGEGVALRQRIASGDELLDLAVYDMRFDASPDEIMERESESIQRGLNLRDGPLMKAGLFRRADGDRLLLVIHHMAVDAVSWRILLEELEFAYRQALANQVIELGSRTCSFSRWVQTVRDFANAPELAAEVPYWVSVEAAEVAPLPVGEPESPLLHGAAEMVTVAMTPEETADLLTLAPRAFQSEIMDVLLTALGRALKTWSGGAASRVTLEGHGREPPDGALDLSNSVGWFTTLYPFVLCVAGDDIEEQVQGVKTALRQVPRKGFGYGLLRSTAKGDPSSTDVCTPQLSFNYLGQFDDRAGLFTASNERIGRTIADDITRQHAMDLTGLVSAGHLILSLHFDPQLLAQDAATALLADFQRQISEVVLHGRLRLANDQRAFRTAKGFWGNIPVEGEVQDAYPLSQLQQGLLFQSLLDSCSDAYFVQVQYAVTGSIDEHAFRQAWYQLCHRHAVLRTAFVHEDMPQPLQVVLKEPLPNVSFVDHRHLGPADSAARIDAFCRMERGHGFDLRRQPLMRIAVFQEQNRKYHIIWSYHHILIDGWCLAILQRDFLSLYVACVVGHSPRLPPAQPYRRYIDWLSTRNRDAACLYWRSYLYGYDQIAILPQSLTQHYGLSRLLGEEILTLNHDESAALALVAAGMGVTLSAVFRGLWGLLLSWYNDRDDVVFGTIVSGRPAELPGVEDMVGLFITAVPVRVVIHQRMSFRELVAQLQDDALASETHQHLSLADIQAESSLGRTLFDHMLIFENYPLRAGRTQAGVGSAEELTFTPVTAYDPTHYNFDMTIAPGNEITIKFTYDRSVYEPYQVRRIGEHLHTAVIAVLADPAQCVHDIRILSRSERHLLLRQFNDTDAAYQRDRCFVDMFEECVLRTPDAVAVVCGDTTLTYCELNDAAYRLAVQLDSIGVCAETLVGVCVERTVEMILGPLAVWRVGGVFVPLSPDYPRDRLGFMMVDAGVDVVLTVRALRKRLPDDCSAAIIFIDDDVPETKGLVRRKPGPDDTSYVIFTSGSTGRPKGVAVTNGNLTSMAHAWRTAYSLESFPVRLLQMASFSFDVFVGDLVRALCHGGSLVVCPTGLLGDPAALYQLIAENQISILETTPALALSLMDYIDRNELPLDDLRILIIGSDVLPIRQFQSLLQRLNGRVRLFNSYGVTEATVDSCCFEARDASTLDMIANTPIGKPLSNVRLYVLDRHGRLQPLGTVGELHIGGDGVAKGYVNSPDLTASRYVVRPEVSEKRIYKTGDLARWLPDGNMEFLGRIDDQVKLRGFRIELGEIEDQLLRCKGVRRAVVVMRDLGAGAELVGYVELDAACDVVNLRTALRRTLPDYMVPAIFVRLDRLPLNPNGKTDRRALPDPRETAERSMICLPPRTETERRLVEIWQQVLQVPAIGVLDDFFDLGGHSLKAMQITAQIHKTFSVKMELRSFFNEPTIAGLAGQIDASAGSDTWYQIPRAAQQDHYALSHAQRRLWMLHNMEGAAAYNMPEAYVIDVMIDAPVLQRAFCTLIRRHEALRTAFMVIDGEPRQKVLDDVPFTVAEFDLRDQAMPDTRAREIADRDANLPFDLTAPPLLRASLVHLPGSRSLFVLTMHHIIGDGWSGNIVYRELLALYDADLHHRPSPLKPLRIQYKDYAAWQNTRKFAQAETYWLGRLSGMPERLSLPYDFAPEGARDFTGNTVSVAIDGITLEGLRQRAMQRRTTLSTVVLALFNLFLFQWTRQEDLCVGMSVANRNHPDLENLIGFFVNVLPIRCCLSADMEFDELLTLTIERTHEALQCQDYPFDLMVQQIKPARQANRQPLVNVIYAFQNFADVHVDVTHNPPSTEAEQPEGSVGWIPFDVSFATSKFDFTLFVLEEPDQLRFTVEYDSSLFLLSTIRAQLDTIVEFAGLIAG